MYSRLKGVLSKMIRAGKYTKVCVIATLVLALLITGCSGNIPDAASGEEPQMIEGVFEGGKLLMYVETDKSAYTYNGHVSDYIYVTATLINLSEEEMWFSMPTSESGNHQELQTEITNGTSKLIDIDMYKQEYPNDGGKFSLAPMEKYVQNMWFSMREFRGPMGNKVYTEEIPVDGTYTGQVTANVVMQDKIVPFTVSFTITVTKS